MMTLRSALHIVEASGMVEYTLGGHCCQRPAAVQQGKDDDKFEVSPEDANPLVWKANVIPNKQIKVANLASQFTCEQFAASPLVCVFWLEMSQLISSSTCPNVIKLITRFCHAALRYGGSESIRTRNVSQQLNLFGTFQLRFL